MTQLLKNTLLLAFCVNLSFLYACANGNEDANGKDEIQLVSTDPEENAIISAATKSVSFVFDRIISIADKAKISLNGAMAEASVRGYTLYINLNGLEYNTAYTVTVEKRAIKERDGNNAFNQQDFSLTFQTADEPVMPVVITSVSENGFLSVKETSLVNEKGEPVILRGVSFGWHNWWPRFYTENTVNWLKEDWKCSVVRAAIGVEPDGAYISHPAAALSCLYAVVDAAIQNDIYVIIDWHSHSIKLEEAQAFFQLVAQKYKDYPNIIYEIFNEPENNVTWSAVKAYSEAVIESIREIDPKNIILVGSPEWDQAIDKPAADPIQGQENLMYTLHFYAATHGQWLRDRATAALQKNLPLFVSECAGMEASGDGAINQQEWQKWVQWMSDNAVSWCAWSVADKNESCSMIKNTASPVSGWTDNDLKEWGQIVRAELRK